MRETRVDLPHVSLSVQLTGPEHGPLALLLHGFPDTPFTWRHLAPLLVTAGWRVAAPFMRGYAPSGVPDDGSGHIAALVADAVGVHAALQGDDRAVVVGHDWGGCTANALAAHPESPFARVVSMAVPPFASMRRLGTVRVLPRQARNSWYIAFNQVPRLAERHVERLVGKLWRDWSPGYDGTEDVHHVLAALPDRSHRAAAIGYYRSLTRPWSLPRHYAAWKGAEMQLPVVPVLYLHGADDGALDARLVDGLSERLPPGSEVAVIPGAGHFLHLERPDEVGRKVLDFLVR